MFRSTEVSPVASRAKPPHATAAPLVHERPVPTARPLRAAPKLAGQPPASRPLPAGPRKIAALPPPSAARAAPSTDETRQITIIRGGRRPTVTRVEFPERSRLAALPPARARTVTSATDASPILVLRGAPSTRYASAARIEPPQMARHRLLTVIRGTRPRLVRLEAFRQTGPLILTIPD